MIRRQVNLRRLTTRNEAIRLSRLIFPERVVDIRAFIDESRPGNFIVCHFVDYDLTLIQLVAIAFTNGFNQSHCAFIICEHVQQFEVKPAACLFGYLLPKCENLIRTNIGPSKRSAA